MMNNKNIFIKILIYSVLLFATAIIIYNNMVISPKYPLVYSQYNQSILYLIGRMMKAGKVPYIDVIDHKGIYVLLIHYFASLIGENNHIGLFIVGVIFNFVSATYIYKILIALSIASKNFFNESGKDIKQNVVNDLIIKLLAIILSLTYVMLQSLYTISYGTLQSETFITTGILISIYYFVKDIVNDEERSISNKFRYKNTMLYGIVFAFILFIKPNYDLYFLAIAITILIYHLKNKNVKNIINHIIYGVIGIAIGSALAIIYALINGNLKEMFYYTFFVNAIYSNAPYIGLNTKTESILWTLSQFIHIYLIVLVGMILLVYLNAKVLRNKKIANAFNGLTFISFMLIISTLVSARNYSYYLIVLLPFIIIVLYEIINCILLYLPKKLIFKCTLALIAFIILITVSININQKYGKDLMIKTGKDHLKVAGSIKETYKNNVYGSRKNLLVLGSELYLYDYIGVLPSFKYFAVPMISYDYYSEPYLETLEYIKSRKADILVIGLGAGLSEFYKNTNLVEIVEKNYSLISNAYGRQVFKLK